MTSSPGPSPIAARARRSAAVPLFVARQKRAPTAAANSASIARISGAPAPESTPRSRTRAHRRAVPGVEDGPGLRPHRARGRFLPFLVWRSFFVWCAT